jgi:hypothetical protein
VGERSSRRNNVLAASNVTPRFATDIP